jgi:uncharacterized tellurite resistance protein B-like protein
MDGVVVIGGVVAALGIGLGVAIWRMRSEPTPVVLPKRTEWKDATLTPAGAAPRNKATERVARGVVLTQAVLLAVEMARADEEIDPAEEEAIRDFVKNHVPEADASEVTRALAEGLASKPTPDAVQAAIETLRNVASEEQRRLVLQLFVHVAQADGKVRDGEVAFMERIGVALGLEAGEVHALVHAKAS